MSRRCIQNFPSNFSQLLRGAGLAEVRNHALALIGFTALLLPLGTILFKRALNAARREGGLGHY